MAKFCSECGKELEENSKVCKNCGKQIEENINSVDKRAVTTTKSANGFAIAGFVLSLVSLLCCGTTSLLGLIFSIIGLVNANKNQGEGKGLAIAGIIISAILLILLIVLYSFGIIASFTNGFNDGVNESFNGPYY